jgi:hypothetical protein
MSSKQASKAKPSATKTVKSLAPVEDTVETKTVKREKPDSKVKLAAKVEDTEEVEEEQEEVEEVEEEPEEKKKTAKKLPTKPKVVAKTAKGKGSKTVDSAKAKQQKKAKDAENHRYALALLEAARCNYVSVFDELSERCYHDKLGQALTMHILETIDNIQRTEVKRADDYNPFPSNLFILFEDKVSGHSKKKAAVKTKGSEPIKQKTVIKRGERAAPKVEPEEQEDEQEDEQEEADDAEPAEPVKEEKAPARRNITTVTKNGKTYLGFIVMRFVDELFMSSGGKGTKSNEEFTKYVFEQVTRNIGSHISRVIVATVNRLRDLVSGLNDRGVEKLVSDNINQHFKDRPHLVKFIAEYTATYLKLLGYSLGHRIWVSKSGVNPQSVESVIRSLDFGNHDWMVANGFANEEDCDFGLTQGVLRDMRMFEALLNPGPTEEEKKERAAKRKSSTKPKDKAAPKGRGKKAAVEEPEEEAEEEATEEVAEEEAEEEATEEVADEEAEEEATEEVAEEEAEEEAAE